MRVGCASNMRFIKIDDSYIEKPKSEDAKIILSNRKINRSHRVIGIIEAHPTLIIIHNSQSSRFTPLKNKFQNDHSLLVSIKKRKAYSLQNHKVHREIIDKIFILNLLKQNYNLCVLCVLVVTFFVFGGFELNYFFLTSISF